jgi:hypothetical protein
MQRLTWMCPACFRTKRATLLLALVEAITEGYQVGDGLPFCNACEPRSWDKAMMVFVKDQFPKQKINHVRIIL